MCTPLSDHAKERIVERVGNLVTIEEIEQAVTSCEPYGLGETQVIVRNLRQKVTVGHSHGDTIVAVVRRSGKHDPGGISTVMLRERWQLRNVKRAYIPTPA